MHGLRCGAVLIVISFITISCDAIADVTSRTSRTKCEVERTHKMLGYDCGKLDLKEIPKYLKSSTEVLDISYNRIRELTRQSFDSLRDLKYLYLFENTITHIEDDTFVKLTSLEVLDLSGNALREVPLEIFYLPVLRNLYLADMNLGDVGFEILKKVKKVEAPIALLSIAGNRLMKMPAFGILPELHRLNISNNDMRDLTPQQFSPFCKLALIDLNDTRMDRCRCRDVTEFLYEHRHVEPLTHFYCDASSSECRADKNATLAETNDFYFCQKIRKAVMENKQAQMTWGLIAIGVIGFMIFFIGCLYCIHRHNVRKMRKRTKLNNQTVKVIPAKQLEANESSDTNSNSNVESTSPEKLLIKKSNV